MQKISPPYDRLESPRSDWTVSTFTLRSDMPFMMRSTTSELHLPAENATIHKWREGEWEGERVNAM